MDPRIPKLRDTLDADGNFLGMELAPLCVILTSSYILSPRSALCRSDHRTRRAILQVIIKFWTDLVSDLRAFFTGFYRFLQLSRHQHGRVPCLQLEEARAGLHRVSETPRKRQWQRTCQQSSHHDVLSAQSHHWRQVLESSRSERYLLENIPHGRFALHRIRSHARYYFQPSRLSISYDNWNDDRVHGWQVRRRLWYMS